ncbi:MAG: hypothetical protein RR342_01390 [Bacilli bacterium]
MLDLEIMIQNELKRMEMDGTIHDILETAVKELVTDSVNDALCSYGSPVKKKIKEQLESVMSEVVGIIRAERNEDEDLYSDAYQFIEKVKSIPRNELYTMYMSKDGWLDKLLDGTTNPFNITTEQLKEYKKRLDNLIIHSRCYADGCYTTIRRLKYKIADYCSDRKFRKLVKKGVFDIKSY